MCPGMDRNLDRLIAKTLLLRLDTLLATIQDDPVLRLGLLRERERLLGTLAPFLPALCRGPADARWSGGRPRRAPGGRQVRGDRAWKIACYRALFAGLIDGRRFDAMMVLGARAGARRLSPSLSSPASPSCAGGSVGAWRGGSPAGSAPSARR